MADHTKDELLDQAQEKGLDRDSLKDKTKAEIQAAIDGAGDTVADYATGSQHPASIVEELPVEEKPGPASHMSREIRPDERDLPPGTSALQTPSNSGEQTAGDES